MSRTKLLVVAFLLLPLAGCYSDQKKQLAQCEASAPQSQAPGVAQKAITACMDKAGYRFSAWDTDNEVQCDMAAIVRGQPSADGTDALCFEPKGWLALKIYHFEVPVKDAPKT